MSNISLRGGVYYVRVTIPSDLRWYISKRELKISLKTSQKTLARKLAQPILSSIEQQFFSLRYSATMSQNQPSKRAIEIWQQTNPGKSPFKWGGLNGGTRYDEWVYTIQQYLDAGYEPDENGKFDLSKPPQHDHVVYRQTPAPAPVAVPVPVQATPIQPAHKPQPKRKALPLDKAVELYLTHCKDPADSLKYKARRATSLSNEKNAMDRLKEWATENVPVTEVAQKDLFDFARYFHTEKGNAKSSIRMWNGCIKRFFDFMKDEGHVDAVPKIPYLPKQDDEQIKTANIPYPRDLLQRMVDYLADTIQPSFEARRTQVELVYMMLAMLYTGFRKSEAKITDINTYGGVHCFMQQEMTKGSVTSIRMVPLHRDVLACGFMKFVGKSNGALFPKNESSYRTVFKKMMTALGETTPRKYTYHSLRSTFDSWCLGKVDPEIRKMFMGHRMPGMDAVYISQLTDRAQDYQKEINKLDYRLDFAKLKAYLKQELDYVYP